VATVQRDIALRVLADLSQYTAEFKKIPGTTDKQAAAAGRALAKQLTAAQFKAASAAKKASKQASDGWVQAFKTDIAQKAGDLLRDLGRAALSAGPRLVAMAQEVADLRNELHDTALRTGLTAGEIAGLRLAAEGSGQELSTLAASLQQFPKRIADVARGTGEARLAFKELEIAAKDLETGALRPVGEVMREALEKLGRIENETLRASYATAIFGESGGALMQALSGQELDHYVALSEQFGVDTGPEAAKQASEWERQQALLSEAWRGTNDEMVTSLGLMNKYMFTMKALIVSTTFLPEMARGMSMMMGGAGASGMERATRGAVTMVGAFGDALQQWIDLSDALAGGGDEPFVGPPQAPLTPPELEDPAVERARTAARTKRDREAAAADRARADAHKRLFGIAQSGYAATLDGEARIIEASRVRMEQIAELTKIAGHSRESHSAWLNEELRLEHELSAFKDEELKKTRERLATERDDQITIQQQITDARFTAAAAAIDFGSAVAGSVESHLRATGELSNDASMALWATQLALGLAQAGISTGVGIARALEAPPAAVPYLIAQAVLTGATATASILAVPPPKPVSFHSGRYPGTTDGEIAATLQRREVVVPASTVDRNGGPEAVRRTLQRRGGDTFVLDLGESAVELLARRVGSRAPRPTDSPIGRRRR